MTAPAQPCCPKCGSTTLTPVTNSTLLAADKQPNQKAAQCACGAVFTYLEPAEEPDPAAKK